MSNFANVEDTSSISVAILDFPGIHTCKSCEFEPLASELVQAVISLNIKNSKSDQFISSNALVLENAIVYKDCVVFIFTTIEDLMIEKFLQRIDFSADEYSLHKVQDIDIGNLLNPLGKIFHKRSFTV